MKNQVKKLAPTHSINGKIVRFRSKGLEKVIVPNEFPRRMVEVTCNTYREIHQGRWKDCSVQTNGQIQNILKEKI